jgi:hypothetical protein
MNQFVPENSNLKASASKASNVPDEELKINHDQNKDKEAQGLFKQCSQSFGNLNKEAKEFIPKHAKDPSAGFMNQNLSND